MPDLQLRSAAEVFAGFVSDERIAAYEKLRAHGGIPKEQAAEFVGSAQLVQDLIETGMAYVIPHTSTSLATIQAAPLDLALMGVLADLQAQLSRKQELLLDGNRKLADLQMRATWVDGTVPEHLMKVITDRDEVLQKSKELIASAHRDWMILENGETDMPITDDYAIDATPAVRQQVRSRAIYDAKLLENPAAMRCITRCAADGEEARMLPSVQVKVQIVDETAVMLPLSRTGSVGAVIFYAEPIVRLVRDHFEMKWIRATPIGTSNSRASLPLPELTLRILELLARGKSNESVASAIGKSESTVQRHLDTVEELLGLKSPSRFELGFAVGRSGLLGTAASNPAGEPHA